MEADKKSDTFRMLTTRMNIESKQERKTNCLYRREGSLKVRYIFLQKVQNQRNDGFIRLTERPAVSLYKEDDNVSETKTIFVIFPILSYLKLSRLDGIITVLLLRSCNIFFLAHPFGNISDNCVR
jgi:hypothetical protein